MKRTSSHLTADTVFSPSLRHLAWLNIAVQAAFPLAATFTPLMAAAVEQHFLQPLGQKVSQRTQVYTLGSGETAQSVAKRYNLTLEQLRQLNQFRTFAHGLNNLQPGDELDVPLVVEPKALPGAPTTVSGKAVSATERDEQAQKVASYASRVGNFLATTPNGDAAAATARGMATGEVGGEIQRWLSRFGTARVQLNADKNFSLKNSQFDLLIPLYDRGDNLVFTQGSLHRTDGRTQANLGSGLRHFTPTYMLGGNLFVDYDLSRDHARTGWGVEYWRDFLKMSVNGYMRLTGWRDSPDITDYQERPANGWDVRAQAWLPALPQLGGKLTYEQYYGKEVALFGVDNRQTNPHAITAGINYTPVPLITLGAEQRLGQSGKSDTRFSVDMNYQLGVPWRSQVDSTAVAAMRSLKGSRYDLVERNNNIVLEYRKKDTIRLHTADLVTGPAGAQKSLGVLVTSTYGLAHIDWAASALITAGGKLVQKGSDWYVVLPAYHFGEVGGNSYTVSGVAVDIKGNRSDRSETQVTVQAPEVNKQNSTFTPVSSELPADGKSTQVLTLTLRDENRQPVDLDVKDISLKSRSLKSATLSTLHRKSAGVYTVKVTAGTDSETVTLTPLVRGVELLPAGVTIGSATPDIRESQFTASPQSILADNSATSMLKLVVKGKALNGLKDSLTFVVTDSSGKAPAPGTITLGTITESSTKGTFTATLKGTVAGRYTVVPESNGSAIGGLSATVTLIADTPDPMNSSIATDTTTYVAGSDIKVTVTLKDAGGKALTGESPLLTAGAVQVPNATLSGGWTDNNDGTYTATYKANTVSTGNTASLTLSGWSRADQSATYDITASSEAPDSIITQINAYSFKTDAGFPNTGFKGATFTIVPKNSASASDYIWSTDASWVSVTDGVVKFISTGNGDKVTITGIPKSGVGKAIAYSFTLKSWFINSGFTYLDWPNANTYCSSQPGYSIPTVAQMAFHNSYAATKQRGTGALWNEWGSLLNYSAGFIGNNYWSSEPKPKYHQHYSLDPSEGNVDGLEDGLRNLVLCRQGF